MLHEQVQEADFVVFDLWDFFRDDVGDEVGAPRFGGEGELCLEPGHCCCFFVFC